MAKKQQPKLSYGPNMGLIAGEAAVAKSEANLGNTFGAFAQGFQTVFGAIQKANQERDARMEAYEAGLPGVTNVNLIQDPANKQIITSFLNEQRDEFNRLAQIFDKTKDRNVKDQMEAIKFSLVNLNDQIKVFDQDKMDYRTASDENQLASLRTYDKDGNDFFTNTYTNNARMQVAKNGDLGFTVNNKFYNYKDKAGRWNINANEEQAFILKGFSTGVSNGAKGIKMNPDHVYTNMFAGLKRSTASDLQVLATTDLVGDNRSETFEMQFANGDPKFKGIYDKIGITAGEDGKYNTDWMFDNKNSDKLKIALAEYFKNVVVDGNNTAYKNYSSKTNNNNNNDGKYFNNDQYYGNLTGGVFNQLINELESGTINVNGKAYNVNKRNNSWSSKDGDVLSGDQVLQNKYDTLESDFPFFNDQRFSAYRGRKTVDDMPAIPLKTEDYDINKVETNRVGMPLNLFKDIETEINDFNKTQPGKDIFFKKSGSKYKVGDKTFNFNPGGGGSGNFIKSEAGQKLLQELIDFVNKSVNAMDQSYNSPN